MKLLLPILFCIFLITSISSQQEKNVQTFAAKSYALGTLVKNNINGKDTTISYLKGTEEYVIIKNVEAAHKAIFVTKDSLVLEHLFAKEITYGHSGGKLENRKETIENVSHNKSTYTDIEAKNISVLINDKTAVSRYLLTGTETKKDGKSTALKLNILQVWVKEKRAWKMIARQATKL